MKYKLTLTNEDGEVLDTWTIGDDPTDDDMDFIMPVHGRALAMVINHEVEKDMTKERTRR